MGNKKLVYGVIGVIGSGKDFFSQELYKNHINEGISTKIVDFSDGVRDLTFSFIGDKTKYTIEQYTNWKNGFSEVMMLDGSLRRINNREFMTNIGARMREYNPEFWANICIQNAYKDSDGVDVFIFNSCRYKEEARKIFEFSDKINGEVKIFFTNYISPRYQISDDDSEKYARWFRDAGCKHKEDITNLVRETFYYGI